MTSIERKGCSPGGIILDALARRYAHSLLKEAQVTHDPSLPDTRLFMNPFTRILFRRTLEYIYMDDPSLLNKKL